MLPAGAAAGQSLWLDNISRDLITSGELARLRIELRHVTDDLEVTGVAAFEKSHESLEATLHEAAAGFVAGAGKPLGR